MILDIVQHTPLRVWLILAGLVALGLSQTRTRTLSLLRVTVLPVVLLALSLAGAVNSFGVLPVALIAWMAGVSVALALPKRVVATPGAMWSAASRSLHVPGSWWPLVLIVGSFLIKYVAGAGLAVQPSLASNAAFAGLCSLGFGTFSGLFLARSLSLRRLATAMQPSGSIVASRSMAAQTNVSQNRSVGCPAT